jgi:hypothetical protein
LGRTTSAGNGRQGTVVLRNQLNKRGWRLKSDQRDDRRHG